MESECDVIGRMQEAQMRRAGGRWGPVAALPALCLLWSLGSLRSDLLPGVFARTEGVPALERMALPYALFAVGAAAVAMMRRLRWPRGRALRDAVLVGLGLFAAPGLVAVPAGSWVPELTRVALYSLTPVFAVILEPYLGAGENGVRGGLAAAMVAVAGTLLLFPVELPGSFVAACSFAAVVAAVACVAASNCLGVRVARERECGVAAMAAVAAGTAAVALAGAGAIVERSAWTAHGLGPVFVWAALVDVPALGLLFWLMRRMSAARMTTRFVVAPLLTNLIGLAILQPSVSMRDGSGLVLIACGAGWLLAGKDKPDAESEILRIGEG